MNKLKKYFENEFGDYNYRVWKYLYGTINISHLYEPSQFFKTSQKEFDFFNKNRDSLFKISQHFDSLKSDKSKLYFLLYYLIPLINDKYKDQTGRGNIVFTYDLSSLDYIRGLYKEIENEFESQETKTTIPPLITNSEGYTKRVAELIRSGENKQVEFKSTLRLCLSQKSPLPKIEHSVLKTIAAFLNSDGGTLLVGVEDNGNILGLENDYSTFGLNKNLKDEWLKHFDNITGHAFTNAQVPNFKLNFVDIDGKVVAIIEVNTSATPVFMKNKLEENKSYFSYGEMQVQ